MIYLDIPNNQGPIDLYKWVEEDFMTAFREHLANKGESMTTTVQNLEAWRAAAPMRRVLKNLERFTRSAVDWPTPMLSDAEIEHWAQRYEFYELRRRGVRFITFLQCPMYWLKARY